jgi:uncharacterized membrane protein YfcA
MREDSWRRLFVVAASFNFAAGLPALLAPAAALETFGLAPLPDHLFVRATGLLVATYGIGYWLVSRRLDRREIVWLGVIGKLGVVVLFTSAWLQGSLPTRAFAVGMGDLLFALAFLAFLRRPALQTTS